MDSMFTNSFVAWFNKHMPGERLEEQEEEQGLEEEGLVAGPQSLA
jgi:hypothetical protein